MDYPGLEIGKLSDEDLMNRISEIYKRINIVYSMGQNQTVIDQLYAILETLQFEQDARSNKKAVEQELKTSGVIFDSDHIAPLKQKTVDSTKKNAVRPSLFKRSTTPTNDLPGV